MIVFTFKLTFSYSYGIISFLIPYALALFYILYNKPQFLIAAILGLNGAGELTRSFYEISDLFDHRNSYIGTVLIVEWINVEYLGNIKYDSPVLRFGKGAKL